MLLFRAAQYAAGWPGMAAAVPTGASESPCLHSERNKPSENKLPPSYTAWSLTVGQPPALQPPVIPPAQCLHRAAPGVTEGLRYISSFGHSDKMHFFGAGGLEFKSCPSQMAPLQGV